MLALARDFLGHRNWAPAFAGEAKGTCYRRRQTLRTTATTTPKTTTTSKVHAAITPTPRASAHSNASKNRPIATER